MSDEISDQEIDEAISRIQMLDGATKLAFDHDLQIRQSERGLGLVWADGDGECWAIVPDPFYTKDFLQRLKTMCNRLRRLR